MLFYTGDLKNISMYDQKKNRKIEELRFSLRSRIQCKNIFCLNELIENNVVFQYNKIVVRKISIVFPRVL